MSPCKIAFLKLYRAIILPVVLYERVTWSLTLKEEHRLRMFENIVLRIFGPKKGEILGGWGKLHNEKLHNWHSSSNIIGMIK
jgi:hypothetical protein